MLILIISNTEGVKVLVCPAIFGHWWVLVMITNVGIWQMLLPFVVKVIPTLVLADVVAILADVVAIFGGWCYCHLVVGRCYCHLFIDGTIFWLMLLPFVADVVATCFATELPCWLMLLPLFVSWWHHLCCCGCYCATLWEYCISLADLIARLADVIAIVLLCGRCLPLWLMLLPFIFVVLGHFWCYVADVVATMADVIAIYILFCWQVLLPFIS